LGLGDTVNPRAKPFMIPLSILDLAPIVQGSNASEAFRRTLDLAQHAETWGYRRFWMAEHHGMPGIASAATSVLIGHVAAGTKTIRVGAGGSCSPTTPPSSSPSSSAPSRRSSPAASTSGWEGLPAATRRRLARCGATLPPPTLSPRTSSN